MTRIDAAVEAFVSRPDEAQAFHGFGVGVRRVGDTVLLVVDVHDEGVYVLPLGEREAGELAVAFFSAAIALDGETETTA